jgi:NADPH:quinone reductase-like Zn-dependent oxidoreductase
VSVLEVSRDDLRRTRLVDEPPPSPAAGEALLRVDAFGLTANNVTYAVFGDGLRYWSFFPAQEGWGRVPVWGFAEVVASENSTLPEGARVFGYCPMASHLLLRPGHVDASWVFDATPHRRELPPAYNAYRRVETDPAYAQEREGLQIVLRPLFALGFMLDDFLAEHDQFGADVVVLSSASSKTALATAFALAARGVRVVGLTSPGNAAFVRGVGVYDDVATYDDPEALPDARAVFVDIAGDATVRAAVHRLYEDQLAYSALVGATHWDAGNASGAPLPGPEPTLFFAPDRFRDRTAEWGADGLEARMAEAWAPFADWCERWLAIERRSGPDAVQEVYADVLDGRPAPDRAYVLSL